MCQREEDGTQDRKDAGVWQGSALRAPTRLSRGKERRGDNSYPGLRMGKVRNDQGERSRCGLQWGV